MPDDALTPQTTISPATESAGEMRRLYRQAEAKTARLRLLFETAHQLATTGRGDATAALDMAAQRAARFLGFRSARIAPLEAPGEDKPDTVLVLRAVPDAPPVATLQLFERMGERPDQEDLSAVDVLLQLLAATLDARRREAERDVLLQRLEERERQLANLVTRLIADEEKVRRRLANDLHDSAAQLAGAALRRLEVLRDTPAAEDLARTRALERSIELVRATMSELRQVIGGLRPTLLDDLGLEPALRAEARIILEPTPAAVDVKVGARLTRAIETCLFRAAQEAMHNIKKHGRSVTRVELTLHEVDAGIVLEIVNDGASGEPAADTGPSTAREHRDGSGFGIAMMTERVSAFGGKVAFNSLASGGARLRIEMPLAEGQST